MKHPDAGSKTKNALILSGGGARAAYQVGVLKAIAELLPKEAGNPFPIICGTSAGAINTAALAIYGKNFSQAVTLLLRVWANFRVHHVFRTDFMGVLKNSARWLGSLFRASLGQGISRPVSLFDRAPLQSLLEKHLPCERIALSISEGIVESVCITASSYGSGKSISFYHSASDTQQWSRARRLGLPSEITNLHLMASSAIPLVFSAIKLGKDYFGDGSMRQTAPMSPAIHLGADNLLVIGVASKPQYNGDDEDSVYPSFAQIGGHILNSIFIDNMEADLERLQRINNTLQLIPSHHLEEGGLSLRPVSVLAINPSQDLQQIAAKHLMSLPRGLRFLLRMLGAYGTKGSSLVSYLMFEKDYCRELIGLGYTDAMARRQELIEFLGLEKNTAS